MTTPKAARTWKPRQPNSLRSAMELCLEYARVRHNRSVDSVADLMGLSNKWAVYKWLENGRLPAVLIRPFENACGIDLVTRYIAYSAHRLVIAIPSGKRIGSADINTVQSAFTEAIGLLLRFHAEQADADKTAAALTTVLEQLAWHREAVERHRQPQLDFSATAEAND